MVGRGRFVYRGSLVYRGSMSISFLRLRWIDRGALIGDLSNKSIVVISSVGGGLDSSIRKSNGERSSNLALSILSLSLPEVVLGVVISYSVFIGKWLRGKLLYGLVGRGRVVGGRGSVGWGASSVGEGHHGGDDCKL